ncbi:MAG TPA: ABC transporter permease [Ignavibacteriaceae bacterium]|nr:ABC transporter permease [Ignavibacteriaceae bacterium]
MLKNYIKIALRNLRNNKVYSFINISGLAIGIACFMLIYLFVVDELSYDKFHTKADRIYRLTEKIDMEGQGGEFSSSNPFPVMKAMLTDYPEYIEEGVRLFNFQQPTLTLEYGDNKFNEKHIYFADSTFFKVFDFSLKAGNKNTALANPNSIILSQELANKYFGNENPLGKTIIYEANFNLLITGIFDELPTQSHFNFDCLISFSTVNQIIGPGLQQNWVWNPNWTYFLLKDGVDPKTLEKQFPEFVQKYYPPHLKPQITHYLQPLKDIHLKSNLDYEMQPNNDEANIYIFSAVGILIILIACINFMNLATARSAKRAREVGMRKVLGADRQMLIKQFLGESLLLSFFAVIVSVFLIELLIPVFNNLAAKELSFKIFSEPTNLILLLVLGLIVGIASGIYPAFFLSASEPIKVVKGSVNLQPKGALLRKGLVVLQFTISLALIIGTLVIYQQLQYMQNANLGFNKENVLLISFRPPVANRYDALKNELLRNENISFVTNMNEIVGEHHNTHEINYEGLEAGKWVYFPGLLVDEDFTETFDLKMIAGRDFAKEYLREDSLGIIVNEAMIKELNWGDPESVINKRFNTIFGQERIVGVVKDFNFVWLKEPIGPFFLDIAPAFVRPFFLKYAAARIKSGDMKETISYIEAKWNELVPEHPFEFSFLDENLNKMYKDQDNLGNLVGYFSILAIFIACLGMFALASFNAEQRTKEIGVRKVLGASVSGIVFLFTKDFLKLVLIAVIIATPLAYFILNRWLEDFAYRVNISPVIFIAAAVVTFLIALSTVAYQAIKAANANPIKSLRYE